MTEPECTCHDAACVHCNRIIGPPRYAILVAATGAIAGSVHWKHRADAEAAKRLGYDEDDEIIPIRIPEASQ